MNWLLKMALSVGVDLLFTAASVGTIAGGFGLLILAAKSALSNFIVSIIEMVVDKNFSQDAFETLLITTIVATLAGPGLSRYLPKAAISKFSKFIRKWAEEAINSLISNIIGDRISTFVAEEYLSAKHRNDPPPKPGKTFWKQGK